MLTLDLFLPAADDAESARYRVLSTLQSTREAFKRNSIYPHLGRLIKLHDTVSDLVDGIDDFREALPARLASVDLRRQVVLYQQNELDDDQLAAVEELMRWALPLLQEAIEEGRTIFEFVDNHMTLTEVGIVPSYVNEGYLLVPDRQLQELHVLRYELSVLLGVEERFQALRTVCVKTLSWVGVERIPASIKLDLVAENRDLPNPATYHFQTDLEFPFSETLLPVAKRKLMRYLYSQGLAA
jgi:hypothetical protein